MLSLFKKSRRDFDQGNHSYKKPYSQSGEDLTELWSNNQH